MENIFNLTSSIFDAVQLNKAIVFNDLRTKDEIDSISNIRKARLLLISLGVDVNLIDDGNSIILTIYDDTPIVEAVKIVKKRLMEEKVKNIEQNIKKDIIVLYEPLLSTGEMEEMVDKLLSKYNYPVFIFTDDKIPGLIHGIAKNNREMEVKELAETTESLFLKCISYENTISMVAQKVNFDEIRTSLLCAYDEKVNNEFETFVIKNEMIMKSC